MVQAAAVQTSEIFDHHHASPMCLASVLILLSLVFGKRGLGVVVSVELLFLKFPLLLTKFFLLLNFFHPDKISCA